MIIGIDQSYSSTGVAIVDGDKIKTYKISSGIKIYDDLGNPQRAADSIIDQLREIIPPNQDYIYEVPALRTVSGAYLAVLMGKLDTFLKSLNPKSLIIIPPTACNSWCGNKTKHKTFIVDYCKNRYELPKRISHDECSALIFVEIHKAIALNKYKNKYSKLV